MEFINNIFIADLRHNNDNNGLMLVNKYENEELSVIYNFNGIGHSRFIYTYYHIENPIYDGISFILNNLNRWSL